MHMSSMTRSRRETARVPETRVIKALSYDMADGISIDALPNLGHCDDTLSFS